MRRLVSASSSVLTQAGRTSASAGMIPGALSDGSSGLVMVLACSPRRRLHGLLGPFSEARHHRLSRSGSGVARSRGAEGRRAARPGVRPPERTERRVNARRHQMSAHVRSNAPGAGDLRAFSRPPLARTRPSPAAIVAMPIVCSGARRRSVGEPGLKIWKPSRPRARDVRVAEHDRVRLRERRRIARAARPPGPGRAPPRSAPRRARTPAARHPRMHRDRRRCRGWRAPAARTPAGVMHIELSGRRRAGSRRRPQPLHARRGQPPLPAACGCR